MQNYLKEWSFRSDKKYDDAFNQIEFSAVFTDPDGKEKTVPGFWSGDDLWKVRYASSLAGKHSYRTICSKSSDSGLHGKTGEFEVVPYEGKNPLFQHGALEIAPDKRHFQHRDGTPFFWLADTWWMGFCKRLSWPEDFKTLTEDRVSKDFTVIQIVAGLYPDMPPYDERGANEAGFPWENDYQRINPGYFDMVDLRIEWLVRSGLVPCIVGCWGYFLEFMGIEKMKKHWRYLVARYGAYPVVWCLAGEAIMPYYSSKNQERDRKRQKKGWTEIARYIRQINVFNHPITIHSSNYTVRCHHQHWSEQIEDYGLIDFKMLQTGHGGHYTFLDTIESLRLSMGKEPKMPILVGEVCYEGICEANREEIQRLLFWSCILSGAAGHTYGANGLWQINTKEKPFAPPGSSWGDTPWEEAYQLPGSKHLGIAKKFLERYPWWQFEPHQEWIEITDKVNFYKRDYDDYFVPYAAGIPRKVRFIYLNPALASIAAIKGLESDVTYKAFLFNPSNGSEYNLGKVIPDEKGNWKPPQPPIYRDWVLVLEQE